MRESGFVEISMFSDAGVLTTWCRGGGIPREDSEWVKNRHLGLTF